jgi:hypothetical protein
VPVRPGMPAELPCSAIWVGACAHKTCFKMCQTVSIVRIVLTGPACTISLPDPSAGGVGVPNL